MAQQAQTFDIGKFRDEFLFSHSLPISASEIEQGEWQGTYIRTNHHGKGDPTFPVVIATIKESVKHPGYFDLRVVGRDCSETIKPVRGYAVGVHMERILNHHGRKCSDLDWKLKSRDRVSVEQQTEPSDSVKGDEKLDCVTGEIVYFLRAGPYIKIGKATNNPKSRINSFKTGCPYAIELIGFIGGGLSVERSLHLKFANIRTHGEWFHATPELEGYIAEAIAQCN